MISLLATVLVFQAVSDVLPAETPADRQIVVALASGRHFSGEIDPKTDQEHLWLRSSRPGVTLLRPIAWNRVVSVDLPEEQVRGDELLAAVQMLAAEKEGESPLEP